MAPLIAFLSILAALPAAWADVADTTPAGMARSAQSRCTGDDCLFRFRRAADALALSWGHRLVDDIDRGRMVDILRDATTAEGTDWLAAQAAYVSYRQDRVASEDRAMAPLRYQEMARRARRESGAINVRTTCTTTSSRFGYSATTTCTTTGD